MTNFVYGIKIVEVMQGVNVLDCISFSYKSADIDLRKKLAFTDDTVCEISSKLIKAENVSECVIICTCNRTEVYYCGNKNSKNDVLNSLAEYSEITKALLSKHLLFFEADNAITHLFKVACGIDSMVIGEDEILGQTKSAYLSAKQNNTVSYELNMIFQAAFACAKKIKTETALSKTSVSTATLAANEAAKFSDKVNVLVIGASGKIGTTVLKNLASHKNVSVRVTLRHHNSSLNFIQDLGIETVPYQDRYEYIKSSDCIISATASPHYTITQYDLRNYLTDNKKRLFIDLAVPPDIEESVLKIDGVRLINIDYFQKLAKENNALKIDSVEAAKEIIKEEVDALKKDLIFHDFLPLLNKVKENFSDSFLENLIYKMKSDTSSDEFSAFIKVLKEFC